MAQQTQLDIDESEGEEAVLPIAQHEPPLKKHKPPAPEHWSGQCYIKWILAPTGWVPFVKPKETETVFCGKSQMVVDRVGGVRHVICLSGCADGACSTGSSSQECACFCHMLKAHYNSLQ